MEMSEQASCSAAKVGAARTSGRVKRTLARPEKMHGGREERGLCQFVGPFIKSLSTDQLYLF